MADKVRYPQIPSTVWWGVRAILQRTPKAIIDERLLGVQLEVQEAAARAYLGELKSVGLLNEENKATEIAQKWRLDETYEEAVRDILTKVYPEGLINVAPPGEADRQKVVSWFCARDWGKGQLETKQQLIFFFQLQPQTKHRKPLRNLKAQKPLATETNKHNR